MLNVYKLRASPLCYGVSVFELCVIGNLLFDVLGFMFIHIPFCGINKSYVLHGIPYKAIHRKFLRINEYHL
jgi:hypothetical protein